MSRLVVTGGHPLVGTCPVQGSKNVALHLYAAALLMRGPVTIHNAPAITDTAVCVEIATHLGAQAGYVGTDFHVTPPARLGDSIPAELGRRIRPTACFGAAVLASTGRIWFPLPGGDAFCDRPIGLHLTAMANAGATVENRHGGVDVRLTDARPKAFSMSLNTPFGPSLGATVTALFMAVRANGTSVLEDISVEPEVLHTVDFLNSAGARIELLPGNRAEITGVDELGHADCTVPADRLEVGTIAIAAAITGGQVLLTDTRRADLTPGFLDCVEAIGMVLHDQPDGLFVRMDDEIRPGEVVTGPHPEFPTDLQPQATTLLTQANGTSQVVERVYQQRATHTPGLRAFGADIEQEGNRLKISGPTAFTAADVEGNDIRCVTALVLAALAARGESRIAGLYHLARGYGALVPKLIALGAEITFVENDPGMIAP